ncbi:prolyl oligopeptidase family serine peptidase [Bacteroidales bacterium OttesenSCG-928-B11]|nr:prolyl oligopeptidase family serine peptidase [Bacteroidales bacterium OttesenSCG-928-E04]MDL2308208.1 prolyl oligopeptidase family serine peptidase [Bacteroidales bacterium OttesenSCG-928-C03]MDL2312578.1 prolyl oligopeptidase family serine peptidase [Bacteroidales bacterium OttesenSCG-928-B11]MDL2325646.1 prolyl oligopeptidase family serine peptidase [Bacteroidales bacterium OttesenSCG-928-A14]
MKKFMPLIVIGLLCATGCEQNKPNYPETKKTDVTDDYFGETVADPYRWLEYDTAADVKEWVAKENAVTDAYLAQIPFRENLENRFKEIWDYPKYGSPFKKGDRYFFMKNDGLQNQYVLYMQNSLDGEAEVLLDPNTFSEDGTVSLAGLSFSKNGRYMAYMTSTGGSDWRDLYVLDVETKELLPDHIEWIKFSGMAWLDDGFFYSAYDKPGEGTSKLSAKNEYHKVYYHTLGTPQSQDQLMYEDPNNPLRNFGFETDEDEQFIFLTGSEGTSGNSLYIKNAKEANADFIAVSEVFDYDFSPIDVINGQVLIMTNHNAPKYRLVLVDPAKPSEEHWREFVPENENILQSANLIGGKIALSYLRNAQSAVLVYNTDGTFSHEVDLPPMGSVSGFSGSKHDNIAFYTFASYTMPGSIYKYDMATNTSELYRRAEIDFDTDAYETQQIFFESKDGTKIPMFVTHKKGIVLDGNNPLLLYGYGGFNISLTPRFSISNIPFLENGGIYVDVNLRGGGEFGSDWHKAGTQMQKQNVFDDFIAAAEWLIANQYTNPEKIAILGGSNGGLLVGACMTQRPDLFKVALPQVGVLDMLRYHKFTIGWAWAGDYGTSEDSKEMYEYLKGYSPLHNIKKGVNYPATLVTTADHDDRVVPAHSFKFIATLQENDGGKNPVLIRIETNAGHGSGKPTAKVIEETTDRWAFTMYNLGMSIK